MKKLFLVYVLVGLGMACSLFFIISLNSASSCRGGVLTLSFDDGTESQYNIAFKAMQKKNLVGNLFLVANWTGSFDGRKLMDFDDAQKMQEAGWDIGSHSLSHDFQNKLTKISDEKLKNELLKSKEILEDSGFKVRTFAFPFGDYNERVIEETKKYYTSSRPMEWGLNSLKNLNFYELKSRWVTRKHSSEEICSWIDEANNEKKWLILSFHYIGEEEGAWDFSEQKFKEVLNCVKEKKIKVKTIKEVLKNEKRN